MRYLLELDSYYKWKLKHVSDGLDQDNVIGKSEKVQSGCVAGVTDRALAVEGGAKGGSQGPK